jgi:hypothetical protein
MQSLFRKLNGPDWPNGSEKIADYASRWSNSRNVFSDENPAALLAVDAQLITTASAVIMLVIAL